MVRSCGKNDECHMARRVLMGEVSGVRVRGRPRLSWMVDVKAALLNRGMTVEAEDRKERRALVLMKLNEFHAAIFIGPVFFRPPSRALVVITWRGVG